MRYVDTPTAEAEIYVDAPPAVVWKLVTDIALMAELSPELQEACWIAGARGPAVGHRFVGRNFRKHVGEWETTSIVVDCEPERVFAWAVQDVAAPSAIWRFTLRQAGTGTALSQWVQIGPGWSGLSFAIDRMPEMEEWIVAARLREFRAGMEANLASFKQLAERVT